MPPRGGTNSMMSAPRLPPMRALKVRRPNKTETNPCMGVMSTVLGCWASAGPQRAAQQCMMLEQQLRACMDAPKGPAKPKSRINSDLNRLYPQIVGPKKRS